MSPVHIKVFYQSPLKDIFVLFNAVDTFHVKAIQPLVDMRGLHSSLILLNCISSSWALSHF